ncbi:hypothetical protein [Actinomadura sp. WMMB 499]|uniref:hypothetical protein n=1 Tax=Actinomadura sp. WMMB 499 TaxID=1219491 RepID=UPI00159E3346|nr:hypothetical protein [Actinomadura sp. WMMB 499]
MPLEALHTAMSCWIRLWGLPCTEVLDQLDFVNSDLEPIYEKALRDLAGLLGLECTPPG